MQVQEVLNPESSAELVLNQTETYLYSPVLSSPPVHSGRKVTGNDGQVGHFFFFLTLFMECLVR